MTLEELADPRLGHRTDHSIRAVARGYCRWPSLDEGELVQEGIVGLLRAVHRFDSGVDAPFWAYAVFWVRQAMQRLVAELMGAVVLSDRALRQMARVKAARREYQRTHSGEPTSRDLAALTGFDVAHVDGLTVAERRPRALGEPVREDSGSSMTFADLVVDARAEDAYEEVASSIDSGPIEDLLDRLNEHERTVIRARFGLGGPQRTLREVGAQLRISAERVRQIQERSERSETERTRRRMSRWGVDRTRAAPDEDTGVLPQRGRRRHPAGRDDDVGATARRWGQ